jgi:hypothetical protein
MSTKYPTPGSVIEPTYFSNWGDLWYPKTANLFLGAATRIPWLTPNQVTLTSFFLYALSCYLIVWGGAWTWLAVITFPVSYILDCLDGQLARYTGRTSPIGDYLDKTLDVFKLGLINLAMAVAAYNLTGQTIYFILGFLSCFGFMFRYYIKLETMFGAVNKDKDYLDKSYDRRHQLYAELDAKKAKPMSLSERLKWRAFRHHSLLALDEAEHVTFGALAALAGRPDLWLWLFGIAQPIIALVRLVQRGDQLVNKPHKLLEPMRK